MNSKLAEILNRPLNIGATTIEKRLVLAPMAFLGNVAFRQLVQTYGGYGLMFTEMCSAKRIPNENRHRSTYFRWRDAELSHLVCQIFGDDPMNMAAAAQRIEAEQFFGVDINFGCSEVSICRQNCGAAILKSPDLAAEIVSEVRKAVSIPLFVKYRIGWKDNPRTAIEMARRFEEAGADALTFHPRIAPDRRLRPAKWEYIGMVKQAVTIPVFGNGDVFDQADCLKIRPKALRRFKKFGFYFSANFKFGHTLFSTIQKAETIAEAKEVLHRFFERPLETVSRPNLNFFR
jgi:nifR3 family TIM-barrel protein